MARPDWYCNDVRSGKLNVRTVYEDERVLAFHHPRPVSEVHVVVIPNEHVPGLLDPKALDSDPLTSMLKAVQHVVASTGVDERGFYVRANAASPGVTPHMHWHVIAPGAGANWSERLEERQKEAGG